MRDDSGSSDRAGVRRGVAAGTDTGVGRADEEIGGNLERRQGLAEHGRRAPREQAVTPGQCTNFFRRWRHGHDDDFMMGQCLNIMGINKYCADRDAYPARTYLPSITGDPRGNARAIVCTSNPHEDSFGEEVEQLATGIAEGLADAYVAGAPFFSLAIQGAACVKGVIFACATLALDVADKAGAEVPGVAREAVDGAKEAVDCYSGDYVACAKLGARGARAAGVNIPGEDAAKVAENARKCNDDDFLSCLRLGEMAAEAAGLPGRAAGQAAENVRKCAGGDAGACIALGKQAATAAEQAGVPLGGLKGLPDAADSARKCAKEDVSACAELGKAVVSAALAVEVHVGSDQPACRSALTGKTPTDLAAVWNEGEVSISVFPSDGARFQPHRQWNKQDGGWGDTVKWAAADFNGDGKTDIASV